MTVPLLHCDDARVDAGGAPLLDGLSCLTEGDRTGLVGDWSPLFRLLARQAELGSGSALVHGHAARRAVADGVAGLALHDPGAPLDWTSLTYLEHSARLCGLPRDAARAEAGSALERAGIGALGRRPLGALSLVERREVLLLHAVLGDPPVIALESPLLGLTDAWASHLVQIIERVGSGRRWLISVADPAPGSPERELLDRLDEVLVLGPDGIVSRGRAEEACAASPRYLVVVMSRAARLVQQLKQRGLAVEALHADSASAADAARLVVHVGDGEGTDAIIDAALDAEAPIVELVPLSTP